MPNTVVLFEFIKKMDSCEKDLVNQCLGEWLSFVIIKYSWFFILLAVLHHTKLPFIKYGNTRFNEYYYKA